MAGRREKMLALATGVVLGLWVLDGYVLSPLLELRRDQITKAQKLEEQFQQSERLLSQSRSAQRRLRAMRTQGQLGRDASTTESGLLVAIQGLGQGEPGATAFDSAGPRHRRPGCAGIVISGFRRWLIAGCDGFSFPAGHRQGSGTSEGIAAFATHRRFDDLSMTLRLSSIWEDVPQTPTTADQPALSSVAAEVAP
ncbi:MAG: hypothetical protein HC898_10860 [Phycisphaerales bacterium]|nr:hypothetical protein [Phycisphaerales bacterium]